MPCLFLFVLTIGVWTSRISVFQVIHSTDAKRQSHNPHMKGNRYDLTLFIRSVCLGSRKVHTEYYRGIATHPRLMLIEKWFVIACKSARSALWLITCRSFFPCTAITTSVRAVKSVLYFLTTWTWTKMRTITFTNCIRGCWSPSDIGKSYLWNPYVDSW